MDNNKNIILISVSFSHQVHSHFIPTGILSIATVLRSTGYLPKIIDTRSPFFEKAYLRDELTKKRPKIVGIGFMTDNFFTAKRLAKFVKETLPDTKIILGGPHVTILDEESLRRTDADIVVRGEGEDVMLELADAIINGDGDVSNIAGITFKEDGRIIRTPNRPPPDLARLPQLDFSLIPNLKWQYAATVATGRGCPYKCTFCAAGCLAPTYRERPLEMVISEMEVLHKRYNKNFFQIVDDTFVANPKRVREFCKLAKERFKPNEDFFWYAEGRANILAENPDLIPLMGEAGAVRIQIGVESGSERQLKSYNKHITREQVLKAIELLARHKIQAVCSLIIGGPFEDEVIEKEQRDFILEVIKRGNGFVDLILSFLTPLPGTDIYNHPEKYDIKILDKELKTSDYFNYCIVETSKMKRDDIINEKARHIKTISDAVQNLDVKSEDLAIMERHNKKCGIMINTLSVKKYQTDRIYIMQRGIWEAKLSNKVYKRFSSLEGKDFGSYTIERLSTSILTAKDGALTITMGNDKEITLSGLERDLFELMAGKLTFDEMVSELANTHKELDVSEIRKRGIILLKRLDELQMALLREV